MTIARAVLGPLEDTEDPVLMASRSLSIRRRVSRCPFCRAALMNHEVEPLSATSYLPPRIVRLDDGSYGVRGEGSHAGRHPVTLPAIVHCPTPTCGNRRIQVDVVPGYRLG